MDGMTLAMHIQQSEFHEELVRGLAHKMNNILSLFHGYLGMLIEDKKLDRETLAGLACIRDGANAASELMDRTKVFAKASSAVWREIDVAEFLCQATPAFESLAERSVRVEIDCEENLPRLWIESSKLRMALLELVRNACEASPAGGAVKIEARMEAISMGDRDTNGAQPITWVALSVSDEGEGVAAADEKIFHPFFSTKKRRNALGLGLSVALGAVQQLGGALRHHRENGKTVFRILLPSRFEPVA